MLMDWQDEGIIIGGRRFGETSLIIEVMTRDHGRHPGLVRGGRSRRMLPLLQVGNLVEVVWRARLEDHLGTYTVETTRQRGAELMSQPMSLHGLNLLTALLRLLAERECHSNLFNLALEALGALDDADAAPRLLALFELALLADCGFGLDLDACAATGRRDDLIYVSPRSARAVSRDAGAPYSERLLPLPSFMRDRDESASTTDIAAAFRLTGFFLDRDLFAPRGLALPDAREAFISSFALGLARNKHASPEPGNDLPPNGLQNATG